MSTEIALSDRGVVRPTTMTELMDFAKLVASSSMVPAAYRGKPGDIVIAMQMGGELGLSPLQALQSIVVVNGRPTVYADGMMGLVRASAMCQSIDESYEGEGDNLTAVCIAHRRGQSKPIVGRFSVADAKRAKLWGKAGPWTEYPAVMLKHRARGFCLRDGFADVLRGLISAEEAADIPREPKDITPAPQSPTVLTDALDAFAAEDALEPETATQRTPGAPTEAEVERSQEMIAAVLGPEEVTRLEGEDEGELLHTARSEALRGEASFREWYLRQLDDEARAQLRGHIKELQGAARAASRVSHSEPVPAPDRPREDDLTTSPPGDAPPNRGRRRVDFES